MDVSLIKYWRRFSHNLRGLLRLGYASIQLELTRDCELTFIIFV